MKTTTAKKHIKELHNEINSWKSQLGLERDELKVFKLELAEILSKNTASDVTRQAEHFQNQFIGQCEVCDELFHALKGTDNEYAEKMRGNLSADHIQVEDHIELREKMEINTRLFNDLKHEYRDFLEKWF